MAKLQRRAGQCCEQEYNPFNPVDNSELLKKNLNKIDSKSIRYKFKGTTDPISYAFESIDSIPLKTLARDFVTEGFSDIISFVSKVLK